MNSATIRMCERLGLALGVLAVCGSALLGQSAQTTVGVGMGAGIAIVNLVAIRMLVSRALGESSSKRAGVWAVVFGVKLIAMVGLIFAALTLIGATAGGFMVGVTAVFASVIVVSLVSATRTPEDFIAEPTPEESRQVS